jgi:hypothetical protein
MLGYLWSDLISEAVSMRKEGSVSWAMRMRKGLLILLGLVVLACGVYLISVSAGRGLGFGLAGVLVVLLGAGAITGGVLLRTSRSRLVRACPRCGRAVPVGTLDCGGCGFDFRTINEVRG